MAPMAANVPLTVIFSTVCALAIVPKMSFMLLKKKGAAVGEPNEPLKPAEAGGWIAGIYHKIVDPLLESRLKRIFLMVLIVLLFFASISLAVFRYVPLKMLPFDNKNEFQIVVDMPEGTTLEHTDRVVRALEEYLQTVPEATSVVSYVGISSPIDFNGLVRHYYLRKGGYVADLRVNLAEKNRRRQQSHEIVLRLRKDLEKIAMAHGANVKLVEVPPGPPVVSTVVAEIYGRPDSSYEQLIEGASFVGGVMAAEPFVADIDDTVSAPTRKFDFIIDKEKAALHGVTSMDIIRTLQAAVSGLAVATVHLPGERQPLLVRMILPREKRSGTVALSQIPIKTASGKMVLLAELVNIVNIPEQQPIYHKNLERVVYVMAEMAGRAPAEAIIDMQRKLKITPPPAGIRVEWAGEGEWKITLRVFRDLGIAFGTALLGIYILLIAQTGSFFMPLLIMMAIPLTLLGVMPGFFLLNLVTGGTVGGYHNPVFFTATSMIGMIALGGIVIRNSLILIEFIQDAVRDGIPLKEAILQSGSIRMRPILLTAATTALGAWPITLDPVFSGLAWALIFGIMASTVFTLIIVPVTYFSLYKKQSYPTSVK
jgi:multidrug efflux pump subunit AcrB